MLGFLRKIRSQPTVSAAAYAISRPVYGAAHGLQSAITSHVARNGSSVRYDGVELRFPRNIGVNFLTSISWHGTAGFEPNTWRALRSLIEQSGTFLDIGANIGFYSVLAKRIAPKVEVISFEPVPLIYEQAKKFHEANEVDANIYDVALSDTDGPTTLYLPNEAGLDETTASTLAPASWQARKSHRELNIQSAKLDTFLADRKLRSPVTMKIDVEDHEAAVLRGAYASIKKYKPWIVCEILPRHERMGLNGEVLPKEEQHCNVKTISAITNMDYVAFAITSSGLFRFGPDDFASSRVFTDFLLVPNEAVHADRSYFSTCAELINVA